MQRRDSKFNVNNNCDVQPSTLTAFCAQTSVHIRQPVQRSASKRYSSLLSLVAPNEIAPCGHSRTQASQPLHFVASILGTNGTMSPGFVRGNSFAGGVYACCCECTPLPIASDNDDSAAFRKKFLRLMTGRPTSGRAFVDSDCHCSGDVTRSVITGCPLEDSMLFSLAARSLNRSALCRIQFEQFPLATVKHRVPRR